MLHHHEKEVVNEDALEHACQSDHEVTETLALLVHGTAAFTLKEAESDDYVRQKGQNDHDKIVLVVPEDIISAVSI